MSNAKPRSVLITGATGAIGGALAEAYALPETTLILLGRNEARLIDLATRCRGRGAHVVTYLLDLTDLLALNACVAAFDTESPPDLVILNHGVNINIGPEGRGEKWTAVENLLDVNLRATMALVHGVLPGMRRRGGGQIALVSSLAAYYGLPVTPSYCASKAAVKAYGEALRGWLAVEGIRVNVIMPGYVDSEMCRGMPGPKPFLWSPEKAARTIQQGLARNKARISFPFPLNFGTWWLAVLPAAVSERIVRWLGYHP